ncbi:MAG: cell wall hydrolase [Minisyncoccales bacterium]
MKAYKLLILLLAIIIILSIGNSSFAEESSLELLARLIEGEAEGESIYGKLAVGTVVMNRLESSFFPDTIEEVIFQPYHFSVVWQKRWKKIKPTDQSIEAAKKVVEGYRSFWKNYLYYYNPELAKNKEFIESLNKDKIQEIGNHVFTKTHK